MSKKELIEMINEAPSFSGHLIIIARDDLIEKVNQLNVRKKVKLPSFVAELLDHYRDSTDVDLLALMLSFKDWYYSKREDGEDYKKAIDWLVKNPEKFMRAWLDGYEVEEEKYIMPLPYLYYQTAHYCMTDKGISFRQGNAQKFTKNEIEQYFPEIKHLAKKVDW